MNIRKLINFRLILTIALAVSLAPALGQTSIFVSTSGNDSNNGATWETAKATLSGALSAVSGNTHIYMRVGSYSCHNDTIPNGVTVTGGYKTASAGTDTTQRFFPGHNLNWENTSLCTILDGSNTSRVATINTGGKLEGCVVRNGKVSDYGGGVLIDGGTVLHCVIMYNTARDEVNKTAKGGGAYVRNNGNLLNCVVAYNFADNGSGVAGTDGVLTNNTITTNYAIAINSCGTVTDFGGNVYGTVLIGEQCWMNANLRTTHYADGSVVSGYSNPGGGTSSILTQGRVYTWNAAMNNAFSSSTNPSGRRGVCPTGWHLPSDAEWTQLATYLQGNSAYWCGAYTNIAKSLASTNGWATSSQSCTVGNQQPRNNLTGFNAFPTSTNTQNCSFWSATKDTEHASYYSWYRYLSYNSGAFQRSSRSEYDYLSVRCLRD